VEPSHYGHRSAILHKRLYQAGVAILAAGLCAAVVIYLRATDVPTSPYQLDLLSDKHNALELKHIGGQAAVVAEQFDQWFASLWHGKPLAFTLALLSVGVASLCFWLGDELSPAHDD